MVKNSKPPRILRLISRMNVGGPAQHAIFLTQEFNAFGWETILCSGFEEPSEENMMDVAAARGVAVRRIFRMRRPISLLDDVLAFFHIVFLLWRYQPDIVHTHTAKAGALGRLATFFYRKSFLVHTFHGHVLSEYFNPKVSAIFLRIERFLAKKTDVIITLTATLRDDLLGKGIVPKKKFAVVPLGLDLGRFRGAGEATGFRREVNVDSSCFLVGIVGRLVPIKRHEDLIQAFSRVAASLPNAHLAIIGGGECEHHLRALVGELGLDTKVSFCGFRKDLEKIYPSLDLVVLCSANEGMPLCLIEAMAQGIPIVATRVGGVNDLLSDCTSCRIVDARSPAFLAEAIIEVFQDINQFKSRALAFRSVAYERFDLKRLVQNTRAVYSELLEET